MMKKLLLLVAVLCSLSTGIKAQSMTYSPVVIHDTLHYYFNKFYFKTGLTSYTSFPYYKSAAATVTNVTHCGSRFNNDDVLYVTGLEAFAAIGPVVTNLEIPVHLYLCSLDVNNMPILPAIDSIITAVNSTAITPRIIGGDFKDSNGQPKKYMLQKDFAVLFRNMSTAAGDTVFLLRTNGAPYSNMNVQPYQHSSDGNYGYVRHLSKFYNSLNFNLSPGFGNGTDYEFMVAPRVTYTLNTSHVIPQKILNVNSGADLDTICTRTVFTFTNTSSSRYTNRFYNLLAFYQKWNLYTAFKATPASGNWDNDSAITWWFDFKEKFTPPPSPPDGRVFLPYGLYNSTHTISIAADRPSLDPDALSGCLDNEFRARFRPMNPFGRGVFLKHNLPFVICQSYCDRDFIGIREEEAFRFLQVYPNPLVNGKASISGLNGKNVIRVYDILGQEVLTRTVTESETSIDLSSQASGTYLIRVFNEEHASKAIRVIKQ